jgi:hypothetical protein
MPGQVVYLVCDQSNIDSTTGECTHVQYVQAPTMLPPLDMAAGAAIGSAAWICILIAAGYRKLASM